MNLRWRNYSRLANSKTHHKSTSKNLAIVTGSSDVYNSTNDPHYAELSGGPYAPFEEI
jgi:hypothetical protein